MAEHPDVARHREGHDAFKTGDMEALATVIAEDTVWHWSGNNPISGEFRGRDAVFGNFAKLAELSGETLQLEDHDFLGNDDHTVALTQITATREGKSLDTRFVEVCHWRDGQITEEWLFTEDQNATDDFWS